MSNRHKTHILQLKTNSEKQELQFELDFQASLTTQERFDMMFKMSNIIKELLISNGYRKPVEIIQRT